MGTNLIEEDRLNSTCDLRKLVLSAGRVCENDPEEYGRLPRRVRPKAVSDTNDFFTELAFCLVNLFGKLCLMNKTGRNHRHAPIIARPDRTEECSNLRPGRSSLLGRLPGGSTRSALRSR